MKKKFSKILGVGLTLALLISLLLTAVPVSADVSQPEVDLVTSSEISASSVYVIIFDINTAIEVDGTDWIEIRFPEDTVIDDSAIANGDVTMQTVSTFGNTNAEQDILAGDLVFTEDPANSDNWTVRIDPDNLISTISANSSVRVEFEDVTIIDNPDDPGMYTLEVRTINEDTWITSEEYEIKVPTVITLPGTVEAYNAADILMTSSTGVAAIQTMLAVAGDGWTVSIGEGRYTENPNTVTANVTIVGSGDLADIVIIGNWTIDVDDTTLDNLTLDGDITVTADDFILQNSVVDDGGTLDIQSGNATDATVTNTVFNVEDDIGITVDEDDATITGSTFNIETGGIGITIGADGTDTDVADSTFSGTIVSATSGVGINLTAATSNLSVVDSTFDSLDTALDIDAGTVTATTNTIQGSVEEAIIVTAATSVTLSGNTITGNNTDDILQVAADAEDVYLLFNTITDNDGASGLLIDNNDTGVDLIAVNNWWGDAAGPGSGSFSDDVEDEPFLAGPISATAGIDSAVAIGTTADFETAVGVTVVAAGAIMDVVAASKYLVNPVGAISNAVGFWDVYVTGTALLDDVEIRIFTDVTENTEVWVWGEARGEWLEATSYSTNLFSGFILVTADINTGVPMVSDLGELIFAVIEPAASTVLATAPTLMPMDGGAADISLTPTFHWTAVAGADGYDFELADNANFVMPLVTMTGDTGRLIATAYAYRSELPYSTAYHWRVRAVSGTSAAGDLAESAWVDSVFVTMSEPEEKTPAIVIEPTPPAPPAPIITFPEITIEQPDIVVPLPAETPITPSWIYVIIGVGGVLVIALIVLIVRTRRVA